MIVEVDREAIAQEEKRNELIEANHRMLIRGGMFKSCRIIQSSAEFSSSSLPFCQM